MPSIAKLVAWLDSDVPPWAGYIFGSLIIIAGLTAPITSRIVLGGVPDSIFGAATYLGITGVAVMTRSNSRTSQKYGSEDFLVRLSLGLFIVYAAVQIEVFWNKPDAASWAVYVLAVITELLLWQAEARRPVATPAPGPAPTAGTAATPPALSLPPSLTASRS